MMIAKLRYKKPSEPELAGQREFTLKENITVPIISLAEKHAATKRTYLKGSKVKGEIVKAQVLEKKQQNFEPSIEGEFCMVTDTEGVFLIPLGVITWNQPVWDEEGYKDQQDKVIDQLYPKKSAFTGEELIQTAETTYNSVKDQTYFGFTVQQLVIIAALTFIVTKISK